MNEGWISHDGHRDPRIDGNTRVEVMFRDATTAFGVMHDWDQNWQWFGSVEGEIADGAIIAYRINARLEILPELQRVETDRNIYLTQPVTWAMPDDDS